jgi:antitoxin (DNA-binding transcriptional repressor) of toxin-antitoxin stability system
MARHISSEKARANWRAILDAVDSGEEIVIERYGHPVAVLSPYNAASETGQLREAGPAYATIDVDRLKAEIIAEVLAELSPPEPISWSEGLAELRRLVKESGSPFADMTTDEIVEKMRETRREIFEAEYAHLYR